MNASSIGRLLATYCLQGLVSLEDLDKPSPGWLSTEADRQTINTRAARSKLPQPLPPPPQHRNLARDWITSNNAEWESMLIKTLNAEPTPPPANPLHGI
jgi:hypothetical protein